jgi:hypothetical protein
MRQKIVERMLLTQSQWDSIPLGDERVDAELEKRIRFFSSQFMGGQKVSPSGTLKVKKNFFVAGSGDSIPTFFKQATTALFRD